MKKTRNFEKRVKDVKTLPKKVKQVEEVKPVLKTSSGKKKGGRQSSQGSAPFLVIKNAREHNLKSISIKIPKNTFSVVTGVSGSGKSSLAFDTILKEGQRRYIASLSSYARQFMQASDKADVDTIEGLSPTISIDQKSGGINPRSTVGTITEVYDFLRLLYARLGMPHCPNGHGPIANQSVEVVRRTLMRIWKDEVVLIMAPIVLDRKGEYRKEQEVMARDGFLRMLINGKLQRIEEIVPLKRYEKHRLEVVIDRVELVEEHAARINEAINKASDLAEGKISILRYSRLSRDETKSRVSYKEGEEYYLFNLENTCKVCGAGIPELEPRLFSFNSLVHACQNCRGLGVTSVFDAELFVANGEKGIFEGALHVINDRGHALYANYGRESMEALYHYYGLNEGTPWNELPSGFQKRLIGGRGDEEGEEAPGNKLKAKKRRLLRRANDVKQKTPGKRSGYDHDRIDFYLLEALNWVYDKYHIRILDRYRRGDPCGECGGNGLGTVARYVTFQGEPIYALNEQTVSSLVTYFERLMKKGIPEVHEDIWKPILREIYERLILLKNIGLHYLTLNRKANTLSGGEAQRIRLASQIGSGLEGCLYILDEPSIGLHASDNQKLISTLRKLRDRQNSLIVVEHDEDTMLAADYLLELGPGAGSHGGEVTFAGGQEELMKYVERAKDREPSSSGGKKPSGSKKGQVRSLTLDYLLGKIQKSKEAVHREQTKRDVSEATHWITFEHINHFNLKDLTVRIPLGYLTVITGVSGSGKSTLLDILTKGLKSTLHHYRRTMGIGGIGGIGGGRAIGGKELPKSVPVYGSVRRQMKQITGLHEVDAFLFIDQKPIGRTSRSNPATYTKAWDSIRDLFAEQKLSRIRGYTKSHFSFNVEGGRCGHCKGSGVIELDMQMFSPVEVVCEVCDGRRFDRSVLEITCNGKNIYDVLEMTIEEAYGFFRVFKKLERILGMLCEIGLDYMKLGQFSTTLSGGEAQRIKLASEIARNPGGQTIYFLDEPTTGLHFSDTERLMEALGRLTAQGHAVVIIEHNMEVIQCSDYVLELGPEGGAAGGELLFSGPCKELARQKTPTGQAFNSYRKRQKLKASGYFLEKDHFRELFASLQNPIAQSTGVTGRRGGASSLENAVKAHDILIEGCRTNNLKNISVRIPKYVITVCTGVSGSGKSSLALESIFIEGQRKYLESFSTYARRFLGRMNRVDAEKMENLSPTICIDRKRASRSPRSIIATQTELYDSLRVLYGNIGRPHCLECDKELLAYSPSQAVRDLVTSGVGTRVLLLAPLWLKSFPDDLFIEKKEKLADYLDLIGEKGYSRFLVDGTMLRLDADGGATEKKAIMTKMKRAPNIFLVIDRILLGEKEATRVLEGVAKSYDISGGLLKVIPDGDVPGNAFEGGRYYTRFYSCMEHYELMRDRPTARDFSFNHHLGACSKCAGIGISESLALAKLVRNESGLLFKAKDHALVPSLAKWMLSTDHEAKVLREELQGLDESYETLTWENLQEPAYKEFGKCFFYGGGHWRGFYAFLEHIMTTRLQVYQEMKGNLRGAMTTTICTACGGGRLRQDLLRVRIHDASIFDLTRMSVEEVREWFTDLREKLSPRDLQIIKEVYAELLFRLKQMLDLGLGYLTLERKMMTLSGGEVERIRLSTQMGSRLSDVIYILDEPSVGLHEYENSRLLKVIERLKDLGNTVIIVEHSAGIIKKADYIIDIGPEAGERGGKITYAGPNDRSDPNFAQCSFYPYLYGKGLDGKGIKNFIYTRKGGHDTKSMIPYDPSFFSEGSSGWEERGSIALRGVRKHNLKNIDVRFPLRALTAISGVSGSGKSSLVEWIAEYFEQCFNVGRVRKQKRVGSETLHDIEIISGTSKAGKSPLLRECVIVDQSSITTNKRLIVANAIEVLTDIREAFYKTRLSRKRGYLPGHFSFNSSKGACVRCGGLGEEEIEMHFLSDIAITCEDCRGKRYRTEVLDVYFNGKNIHEVLQLTIVEAVDFFDGLRKIQRKLERLLDVGLGYLKCGFATSKLSSGERQRLKIARELAGEDAEQKLYILDEPTTGLHFKDIQKLIFACDKLIAKGGTVLVIEHNIEFLRSVDYLIDLGPEGGTAGGEVVVTGTVAELRASKKGYTSRYL